MLRLSHIRFEILRDVIVRDFSFSIQAGEVKTLFGPSGCGKTTILRLISGLNTPKSGQIHNGFRKVGLLFQENRLLDNLTALNNILLMMEQANVQQVYPLAEQLGLSPSDLNKYPHELSGGMAKRVAFLRLLLSGCDLALLDEPFVGLDRDLRHILIQLLNDKVQSQQCAVVLVTHDRFEAVRLSHEILMLSPKGMEIMQTFQLNQALHERDTAYEEQMVNTVFPHISYHE